MIKIYVFNSDFFLKSAHSDKQNVKNIFYGKKKQLPFDFFVATQWKTIIKTTASIKLYRR